MIIISVMGNTLGETLLQEALQGKWYATPEQRCRLVMMRLMMIDDDEQEGFCIGLQQGCRQAGVACLSMRSCWKCQRSMLSAC